MKFLMLSSITFFAIYVLFTHQTPWLLTLFLSSVTFSVNFWLIPGGLAWRSLHGISPCDDLRGPSGWPLLGTLPNMGSLAHRKLAAMAMFFNAKRLMAFSLGTTRVIISSHPDTAKQILCGSSFSDRPVKESARLLMFDRALGFAPSGNYWRHLRHVFANYMFSPRRISSLEILRRDIVSEMVTGVSTEMGKKGVVELRKILKKGSLRNILESVFGSVLGLKMEELGQMVDEGYELITLFNWEDYFPIKFLDFLGVKRKCHNLSIRVSQIVGDIIKDRKNSGKIIGHENNFLSLLLSLPQEDQLCDSDLVAVLWELIFRGTDTVAILLEWIMARIVLHQEIQEKVYKEIVTCVGTDRHVQDSDIQNLPYLQSIAKEVLRLHPPGPLLSWARLSTHDVHVDKHFIPAGTTAMVNMWAIAHDPSFWKDPWVFNPDRFMETDMSIMGSDLRLAPFGAGRRVCPGKALGLATVHLWLARLIQQFKWIPAQPVDLSECLRLSLEMKKPLTCCAVSR